MSGPAASGDRISLGPADPDGTAGSTGTPYSLADRLDPLPDESMCGLAMRYAALYRFMVPERLFDRLRLKRRPLATLANLDPSSGQGRAVGALLNLTPVQAAGMSTWHPGALFASVAGHTVKRDLTGINLRQCCPLCLRESPHHRNFWLLAAIPVCPAHRVGLVRRCPACFAELRWQGPGPHFCRDPACRFDLRDADPEPATEAASSAAELLRSIYDGRPHPGGLGLNDAIEASLILGAHIQGLARQRRVGVFVSSPDVDLPAVLGAGGSVLQSWPTAWHAYLGSELGRRFQGSIMPALDDAFGPVNRLMRTRGGWRTALGDELARFAVTRREVTVKKGRNVSQAVEGEVPGEWICLENLADMLGVGQTAAVRIAHRLGSERAPGSVTGKYVIEASAARELLAAHQAYGPLISLKEAAGLLGMNRPGCARIASHGLLPVVPAAHRIQPGHCIRRADVDALLTAFDRFGSGLPVVDRPEKVHHRVGGRGSKGGFGSRAIIAGVLADEFRPVAVWSGAKGITRYLFLHRSSAVRRGIHAAKPPYQADDGCLTG